MSSTSSKTQRSRKTMGSGRPGSRHESVLSYEAERSLIKAATRKAELECRAKAMQERLLMDKEELEIMKQEMDLKHKKELLEMRTEIAIEDSKIAVLGKLDSSQTDASQLGLDNSEPSQAQKYSAIRSWLSHSEGEQSETKSEISLQAQAANPWDTEPIDLKHKMQEMKLSPRGFELYPHRDAAIRMSSQPGLIWTK